MMSYTALNTRYQRWDRRFLELAALVATWSKDPSMKCGAVIVNGSEPPALQVFSVGYNGFPRGIYDHEDRLADREIKYQLIVHAEENAILAAHGATQGATLYVHTGMQTPCVRCCASIVQAGICRVVGHGLDTPVPERWFDSAISGREMLNECGIPWVVYP